MIKHNISVNISIYIHLQQAINQYHDKYKNITKHKIHAEKSSFYCLLNQQKKNCIYNIPTDLEPNRNAFDSKTIEKWRQNTIWFWIFWQESKVDFSARKIPHLHNQIVRLKFLIFQPTKITDWKQRKYFRNLVNQTKFGL